MLQNAKRFGPHAVQLGDLTLLELAELHEGANAGARASAHAGFHKPRPVLAAEHIEDRAYAIYVLARNGRAPIGELRYYADTRLDRFATPLAKAQIGAALAMLGDKERAEKAFKAAIADIEGNAAIDGSRDDYHRAFLDATAQGHAARPGRRGGIAAAHLADAPGRTLPA